MAKYELSKSVEAKKLNPRTGFPTNDPVVTIPYGAILDEVEHDGDIVRYSYLMQRYQSAAMPMKGALQPLGATPDLEAAEESAAAAGEPDRPTLAFERMATRGAGGALSRAQVPGGWLVVSSGGGLAYVPDSGHGWDGTTVG